MNLQFQELPNDKKLFVFTMTEHEAILISTALCAKTMGTRAALLLALAIKMPTNEAFEDLMNDLQSKIGSIDGVCPFTFPRLVLTNQREICKRLGEVPQG